MIIYVNYDKQTGQVTVDNQDFPGDTDIVAFNPNTLVDNNDTLSFEVYFNEGTYTERMGYELKLEPPGIEE